MDEKLKIIVAHPGQQHSYQMAYAVKEIGCLYRYITTYYAFRNKKNMWGSLPIWKKFASRASNRRCDFLEDTEVLTYGKYLFYIVSFLLRFDKKGNLYRKANEFLSKYFGRKVAKFAIENNIDAVIMYDTNADICFSILQKKAPHIIRIQDVSAINRLYMKNVYEEDMKRSPQCARQLMDERGFLFEKKNQIRWQKEIDLSNYFVVPSEIVTRSLIYSGVAASQIYKCPYGTYFEVHRERYRYHKKLEILYVGNVTQMKGIFYLLEAVGQLPESQYHLTVVGKYKTDSNFQQKHKENVTFAGYVMHEKVKDYLIQADVFVFPSLGDSFGLAVLEALSYGLPVICSDHAGVADAIQDGENGFIVPVGSADAIREKLIYCHDNPQFLEKARESAYTTAERYTWEKYRNNVSNFIEDIQKGGA